MERPQVCGLVSCSASFVGHARRGAYAAEDADAMVRQGHNEVVVLCGVTSRLW